MTSFADIPIEAIRTDCRFYSGYKPCGKHDGCPGCPAFEARGTEILMIKIGAMGDVLRTKCLLGGLKRAHPRSWITWITAPGSEPIVRDPMVDEVLALDAGGLLALEGRRFDLLLSLDKEPAPLALSRRLDAGARYGFAPTPWNRATAWNPGAAYALRLGLSDDLKYRRNRLTHPEILYRLAELDYAGDEYGLVVDETGRAMARARLEELGWVGGRAVVGLNTGCGPVFETKAWTIDGFAGLARSLASSGIDVWLLGGTREGALHGQIMERVGSIAGPGRVIDTGNDNALGTFFALVERCDAVVSSDSLAMHVAIALKRPVVAFFGPTCEQEVDLFGRGEKIVTDYPCSPCYLKRCDVRPSCMQALTAETVEAAVRRVLAAAPLSKGQD